MHKISATTTLFLLIITRNALADDDIGAKIQKLIDNDIKNWIASDEVVKPIEAQNITSANLTETDLKNLETRWQNSDKILIELTLNSEGSKKFIDIVTKSKGLYTEIFSMDNKGLDVAKSSMTSSQWHGDKEKWKKPFTTGDNYIGKIEKDESTQKYQTQISLPVLNKDNLRIGAIVVGINIDML